jgi:predicted Rossmann fold nucleotide-binding protein DprA/Smf involved in DNA uptake
MSISEQSQAVLLLTAWFNKPGKGEPKPLTPKEWGRFALWLKEQGLSPEVLLRSSDVTATLSGWSDKTVDAHRIRSLLERAGALGIALEKWQRAGLWVMTRSDPDYPGRLKRRLKTDAPPVLFGSGNRQLLDQGGIAVVGSREASEGDLAFTTRLGETIALQGRTVVSGGARGVDEAAMLGALEHDGTAIGILADSLLRASNSAKYRRALMDKNLVLVSPFNPEAGFDVGNAMARNKYIYSLSDAAIIVSASEGKGGTWSGAVEALKHAWVPTWIKAHPDPQSGNAALVRLGARWLEGEPSMDILVASGEGAQSSPAAPIAAISQTLDLNNPQPEGHAPEAVAETVESYPVAEPEVAGSAAPTQDADAMPDPAMMSLYDHFLSKLAIETRNGPITAEVIQERLEINKSQLADWLKRGLADGKIEKLAKPVRYQPAKAQQQTLQL